MAASVAVRRGDQELKIATAIKSRPFLFMGNFPRATHHTLEINQDPRVPVPILPRLMSGPVTKLHRY